MAECEVTINNRLGLHARAAAKFVHLACRFQAQVQVARAGRVVDGKSIMGILLLAAAQGSTITLSAQGVDADDAISALRTLVETGFGEDPWNR